MYKVYYIGNDGMEHSFVVACLDEARAYAANAGGWYREI